ncbi:MAG: branched-chain amino acid transporter substrate-binding protein [Moraxellaceae bacterium]|jgi:branched-chain amino acid transport system substrate-binding protein|nr:branched-chain amino acid transporter substrate-binding protein [Moraxellaceae bacterium]
MKKLLTLATLAAAMGLAACSKNESKDAATAADGSLIVKVGHAAPLTGPQAHLGKDNENGVRLAIDELNARGFEVGGKKVTFQLMSEDDQADPRIATTVAKKFVDDGVHVVIGHLNSGTTIPASRIYNDAGIVEVSPSATNPKYTQQGYKGAFRVMANDVQQGLALGEFAVKDMAAKKIAIIDDRTAYGQGLADEFEKAVKANGGTVIVREFTNDKASDFTAILTKIKGTAPDLVFFGGMDGQGAPMARQMKTLGLTAKFLGGDGIHTAEFMKLAGPAAEGVTASLPGVPLESMPHGSEFKQKFEAKYGVIQLYAPYCYDAMMVIAEAMKRAGSIEPARYQPELAKTNHDGVTARIGFDAKGDLTGGAITVYRVEGGEWKVLRTLGGAPVVAPVPSTVPAAPAVAK